MPTPHFRPAGYLMQIINRTIREEAAFGLMAGRNSFSGSSGALHANAAQDEEFQLPAWSEESLESSSLEDDAMDSLKFQPKKRANRERPWTKDPKIEALRSGPALDPNRIRSNGELRDSRARLGAVNPAGSEKVSTGAQAQGRADDPVADGTSTEGHEQKYKAIPSGLSYHAWEVKLRSSPLKSSSLLDDLYRRNRTDPALVNEGVMAIITNPSVLERAFMSMYLRHGQLADAEKNFRQIGESWARKVGARLLTGEYTFPHPSQLEHRTKGRPHQIDNVPVWWHKMVPEAMRLVLEAIFEPSFSRFSHGFRRNRGCHSALKEIKENFWGIDYFMEVDISRCMTGFDKSQLIDALRSRVRDVDFLALVNRAIRAGYLDLSEVCYRCIGVPQTTLLSPILANIYLHKMDLFLEDIAKCLDVGEDNWEMGSGKSKSNVVSNRDRWASRRIQPAQCWREWTLSGLRYVRYGGNLLIGIVGSSEDALRVEKDLQWFVRSQLMLPTKGAYSKIANSTTPDREYVMFLGSEIYSAPQLSSPGVDARNVDAARLPTKPRLCVPARHLILKLEEHGIVDAGKLRPTFNGRLVHWEAHEIVKFYDITAKMLLSYYSFADNYHCLSLLYDILKQSCAMTLGKKLSLKRIHWVTKRFGKDLGIWDSSGNLLAVMLKPKFNEPASIWNGRDINPYARLERPLKPRFPPSTEKPVTGYEALEFTLKARSSS